MIVIDHNHEKTQLSFNARLVLVLLFVLVTCGGNGMGILIGFLVWKSTGNSIMAIGIMLLITILAFTIAMVIISRLLRSIAQEKLAEASGNHSESISQSESLKKGSEDV